MSHPIKSLCVLLLFCTLFNPANGQFGPSIQQLGPNRFLAGIPSREFEFFAAPHQEGRQRQQNWCWAATVQMVLNFHGLYVTQEQVVARVFGDLIDRPGQPRDILNALSGWAPDIRGRRSSIHASTMVFRGSEIVGDLAHRWPIIVGLQGNPVGHAYVLTGVIYSADPMTNEPFFHEVLLRDPLPGSRSLQRIPWASFRSRLMFLARVRVSRL